MQKKSLTTVCNVINRNSEEDIDLDDIDLDNLTKEEIDKMLEEADKVEVEIYLLIKAQVPRLDMSGIKQMLLELEKCINKNQELRLKYAAEPLKYHLTLTLT